MKRFVLVVVALVASVVTAQAQSTVTILWDAPSDPSITGYRLVWGSASHQYPNTRDVGNVTSAPFTYDPTQPYYIAVESYTAAGGISAPSNEVTLLPSGSTATITIGNTNVLSQADDGNGNLLVAQQASLAQSATIQSLSFYETQAAGTLRLGLYDATGPNGGPGKKLAETAEWTPAAGWNTRTVLAPVALSAGSYWLAYFPSDSGLAFVKDAIGQGGRYYALTYGALPATFSTTPNTTSSQWSFYATLNTQTQAPPPLVVSQPSNISMVSIDGQAVAVTYIQPTISGGTLPYTGPTCTPASGSKFPVGTTTVTCTASDAAGATASSAFTVTVTYTPPPNLPPAPSTPSPANGQTNRSINQDVAWTGCAGCTYDVYEGLSATTLTKIATGLVQPVCALPQLPHRVTIYWYVVAKNANGSTAGPVWHFSVR